MSRLSRVSLGLLFATGCVTMAGPGLADDARPKKIVLIAGVKSHGPGHHEYEQGARLLAACLANSPNLPPLRVEVHTDGWPADDRTLDDADTIFLFCDGSDRDERAHPLLHGDRLARLARQMKRGCGFVALHYTIFVPNERGGQQFLDWIGGYFDYQSGPGERAWFSKIATHATQPRPATPQHPICRGLAPFDLREEYYYNLRFRPDDPRLQPILITDIPGEAEPQVVAYAVERAGGGRGFGFSGGHFHDNWQVPNYRRLMLNAIVWTAGLDVPAGGVESTLPDAASPAERPIRALVVTGHQHPAHRWQDTTPALVEALAARDPRFRVTVKEDPEALAAKDLRDHDLVLLNYCNWQRPGLTAAAQANLVEYLRAGGGLGIVHFSNGAFHFSLPGAEQSDWPEYRTKICRRVWDHTPNKSGHDPYGPFRVDIADAEHEITRGMRPFETTDELYFRQQGEEPIHVLATAKSKVTGADEPMAFVYDYGRGRVFQTVLGHDAASIRNPGAAELIRRGCAWAARREQRPPRPEADPATPPADKQSAAPPIDPARFAGALDGRKSRAATEPRGEYARPPLAVECWARLRSKAGFNLLVAHGPKESSAHWELYTTAGSGTLSAFLPGATPSVIDSGVPVTDDRWHYLGLTYDRRRVRLFVDGKQVADAPVTAAKSGPTAHPMYFGCYPPQGLGCDGLLGEVRVSRTLRDLSVVPTTPLAVEESTIGLWRFKVANAKVVADASPLASVARLEPAVAPPAAAKTPVEVPPTARLDLAPTDAELAVTWLDRSDRESFLAVKTDSAGRIFVGGREALFVYEPDAAGGYAPRRELFRFPADSWLFDIEIRGDDLYVMTTGALYLLRDARLKRDGLQAQRLVWGIPIDVHISFHGLAWGPEGDLYFSAGDPLLNYGDYNRADHWGHWTLFSQPDGTATEYTGVGGVFRCRPDGSGLQLVAGGLRGCGGLAFDRDWNLFTNDNDHESLPQHYVPARLLHVAPGVDFGWPRGWMAEKTPLRADLLDTVFAGMGREVPIGQTYYDDEHLPPSYRHSLLVALWGRLTLGRYALRPRGASFAADEHLALSGRTHARPVGVCVGRGGRVFLTVAYMAHNEGSPVYPSDLVMIARADDPPSRPFEGYEAPTAPAERLWSELASASWWRRNRAHQEILRRGGALVGEAVARLQRAAPDDPSAQHLVWLAAASGQPAAGEALVQLASNPASPLCVAAIRALAEFRELAAPPELFSAALADPQPAVQLAALAAWARLPAPLPQELLAGPARGRDTYLRQIATRLLARRAKLDELAKLCRASDSATRLAGVLAVGTRLTVPPATGPLPAELQLTYTSGNAQFDVQYVDQKVDLRQLGRTGSFTIAEWWKQCPRTSEQAALFALLAAALDDPDEAVRQQAAYYLYLLDDAAIEKRVAAVSTAADEARLAGVALTSIDQVWLVGPLVAENSADGALPGPESGAIDLAAEYAGPDGPVAWRGVTARQAFFALEAGDAGSPPATYYAYCRLQSTAAQRARLVVASGAAIKVWHNGAAVYENAVVAGGNRFANTVLLALEPGSNDLLVRVRDLRQTAGGELGMELKYSALSSLAATLPEKLGLGTLAERLRAGAGADQAAVPAEFLTVDWAQAAAAGDPQRGRKLFGADALACVKCHAIVPGQNGGGGPSLVDAGKRFTAAHLVESLLLPGKQVAPVFRATKLVTTDGRIMTGLVVNETAERLEMLLPDATRKTVAKSEIEERAEVDTSPMPAGLVKTPAELTDLLAYLLSPNPEAP